MWALLAPLTTLSGDMPPLQITALAFAVAFLIGCGTWGLEIRRRGLEAVLNGLRLPWPAWLIGVGGLFGYHFLYFLALSSAPPVEASLIAYLWPLLIVLFSALLPGERLRWFHPLGALAGLAGTAILVARGGTIDFASLEPGHGVALAAALVWSGYSVLNRRLTHVPTQAVGAFCGVTAVLAWLAHLAVETTVWPDHPGPWLAVLGLGLGPVGAAFFTWDHGVKRGDIRALGAAAYAAPLLSTLILVGLGLATSRPSLWLALGLIVGGAALASGDLLGGPRRGRG
nr:DMT family transporter [Roseospirillum parvum]